MLDSDELHAISIFTGRSSQVMTSMIVEQRIAALLDADEPVYLVAERVRMFNDLLPLVRKEMGR